MMRVNLKDLAIEPDYMQNLIPTGQLYFQFFKMSNTIMKIDTHSDRSQLYKQLQGDLGGYDFPKAHFNLIRGR